MLVTFGVFGEYDDFFSMNIDKNDLQIIESFISNFNSEVQNVSIRIEKIEE